MNANEWRKAIKRIADDAGCEMTKTRGQHFALRHPKGWTLYTSCTPSDNRAIHRVRSDMRRMLRQHEDDPP